VRLKDKTNTWGQKAAILNKVNPRSYNLQTKDGAVLRQNRCDIIGPVKAEQRMEETAEQPQQAINRGSNSHTGSISQKILKDCETTRDAH